MEKFSKITVGFVTQVYEKNSEGEFVCTSQEISVGDQVNYEDTTGNPIIPPEHKYQPFNMTLLSSLEITNRIDEVLSSINVGGEQSRQFCQEIALLKKLLKDINY